MGEVRDGMLRFVRAKSDRLFTALYQVHYNLYCGYFKFSVSAYAPVSYVHCCVSYICSAVSFLLGETVTCFSTACKFNARCPRRCPDRPQRTRASVDLSPNSFDCKQLGIAFRTHSLDAIKSDEQATFAAVIRLLLRVTDPFDLSAAAADLTSENMRQSEFWTVIWH